MEENPLVSVCMPAYNAGKYVTEAVNSIINQSYQHWELIIVNDGSTDDTDTKIAAFNDARISSYYQPNQGQCAAANKAYHLAKGSLIKFMDADDLISPNMLLNQVEHLNNTKDTIAYSDWGRFYNDDLQSFQLVKDELKANLSPAQWLIQSMENKEVMLQCARWLIPKSVLEKSGLWLEDLSLINDFEFIIRVLVHASFLKYAPDSTLYYRSGMQQSLSGTTSASAVASAYKSIDLGTQHLLKAVNTPQTKRIAADCFQRFAYGFYPKHRQIVRNATEKIKDLGGSTLPFPAGGYTKLLVNLFGWKLAKRFKLLFS